jgi:glutathione synthase/RimK-type ligase-like ATP-grasp enzyme
MHICFVTCKNEPLLAEDDRLLASYLLTKKIKVSPAIWDDENVQWQAYDAVVLRSMWDYHTRIDEFNMWLDKITALGCQVLNPVTVVMQNQNKKYLVNLAAKGVLVPPCNYYAKGSSENLAQIMQTNNWNKVVVKPAVSGGAFDTWMVDMANAELNQLRFNEMLQARDVIVQQFMEQIVSEGELSLLFFNKKFSHAILKKAKAGDFRIQQKYGGTNVAVHPDEKVVEGALKLLNTINEPLLYARVDGILTADGFYLMELELIEPALFIALGENACNNFYTALTELCK